MHTKIVTVSHSIGKGPWRSCSQQPRLLLIERC